MAANNRGTDYADLWQMYKAQEQFKDEWAETHRAQILHWMALEKTLPILSYKTQLEVLDNAPMDIIKKHAHLLHDRAKQALGLEASTKKTQVKNWSW